MNQPLQPLEFGDIIYTPTQIESLCQPVIDVRACLLSAGHAEHAVALSHVIALLNHLKDNTRP